MLYGMYIDWKATVLRSVTRPTTESELYALSAAGVETQYWIDSAAILASRFIPKRLFSVTMLRLYAL
jgi:hypothetical protein